MPMRNLMWMAAPPSPSLPKHLTYAQLKQEVARLQHEVHRLEGVLKSIAQPHHTTVGQWLYDFLGFVTQWFEVFLLLFFALMAWLLWKFLGTMPKTKPQNMAT